MAFLSKIFTLTNCMFKIELTLNKTCCITLPSKTVRSGLVKIEELV